MESVAATIASGMRLDKYSAHALWTRGAESSSLVLKGGAAMRVLTESVRHLTVEVSRRRAPDLGHVLKIPIQVADRTLPRVQSCSNRVLGGLIPAEYARELTGKVIGMLGEI
jgi:hypothetical protein